MYVRLSANLREMLAPLMEGELQPAAVLREKVEAHGRAAREAASAGKPVDLARAEQLCRACLTLIDDLPKLRETNRRLVQGAALYFAASDDEEDDFDSIVGLEDDVIVVNYVLSQLGRSDLRIV
jgi:hypothetical protein